jgi:hypothetical protein
VSPDVACGQCAAYSAELFQYSTSSKEWTKLDAAAGVTGTGPNGRQYVSMGTVEKDIFLFGGTNDIDGIAGGQEGKEGGKREK